MPSPEDSKTLKTAQSGERSVEILNTRGPSETEWRAIRRKWGIVRAILDGHLNKDLSALRNKAFEDEGVESARAPKPHSLPRPQWPRLRRANFYMKNSVGDPIKLRNPDGTEVSMDASGLTMTDGRIILADTSTNATHELFHHARMRFDAIRLVRTKDGPNVLYRHGSIWRLMPLSEIQKGGEGKKVRFYLVDEAMVSRLTDDAEGRQSGNLINMLMTGGSYAFEREIFSYIITKVARYTGASEADIWSFCVQEDTYRSPGFLRLIPKAYEDPQALKILALLPSGMATQENVSSLAIAMMYFRPDLPVAQRVQIGKDLLQSI